MATFTFRTLIIVRFMVAHMHLIYIFLHAIIKRMINGPQLLPHAKIWINNNYCIQPELSESIANSDRTFHYLTISLATLLGLYIANSLLSLNDMHTEFNLWMDRDGNNRKHNADRSIWHFCFVFCALFALIWECSWAICFIFALWRCSVLWWLKLLLPIFCFVVLHKFAMWSFASISFINCRVERLKHTIVQSPCTEPYSEIYNERERQNDRE